MKEQIIQTLVQIAKSKGVKYDLNVPTLSSHDYNRFKGSVPTIDFVVYNREGKVLACFEITTTFSKNWMEPKDLRQRKFKLIERLCYLVFKAHMLNPQVVVIILPFKTPALSFWAERLSHSLNVKVSLITPAELQNYATLINKVG
ncbi:MAG: hypothetical protein RMJ31_05350 [Nitrososphaerota archaeon]|nr:hypothetical protein [Nitrososphaerales archaeon]MDW8045183.1 hypothetical protein [Nitrososphaerota archaeon]